MCPFLQCGLDVYVENGRITKVTPMPEHALRIKELCVKPQGLVEWVYSPERVTSPMLKVKAAKPDVLWVWQHEEEAILLTKAIAEHKLDIPCIMSYSVFMKVADG